MESRFHRYSRPGGAGATVRRTAHLASAVLLALVVLALPVSLDVAPFAAGPAFAAGDDVRSTGAASAEPGEPLEESATIPVAGQRSSTPNVIKEIGGVTGNTELSSEEEIDAIRSGWGTWRTADGPGEVLAQ